MNNKLIAVSLFAIIGTQVVSCQKEKPIEQATIIAENQTVYKMTYSIDGRACHITLAGEEARHDFLVRMITLAKQGHRVSFRNDQWCADMRDDNPN